MQGLIGRKVGMTRVFDKDTGRATPVTIVHVGENVVQQVKTVEKDGYSAVQLGFDPAREKSFNKAELGQFKKAGSEPLRIVREFPLDEGETLVPGQKITVDLFAGVQVIDVIGFNKGRGFAGTVKHYNFHIGRQTHGNSNRRERGSLGASTYPARVFPGLKMAGRWGDARITLKNSEIVKIDAETGLVYVKGGVPGGRNGLVFLRKLK